MQWYVRRKVLNHDMSRYKCCQGIMDGPYCLAACSPSLQLCGCCCTCFGNGEVGASADDLGAKCVHIAHQIMEGIYWVMRIAMGCMSSQIIHECNLAKDVLGTGSGGQMSAPGQVQMPQMPPQMYGQKN